ncbi:CobW/HypB/UreG, nucleotide-binding domain-containing protein [Microdochium trichocladiopsis]|uniref:CobW/HypB/UreG, nucleotide-binding domain-containing protein n=1 Tax=Microdochium trichocladiopsis TaxID=1682393 RepID=A0A9P8Y645_9PEZI|nr:CobW/HypB/UreG, nucleotide-binding domain-containing protein [Microdochium trichocladiopsis]KAH7032790.1 CobW/HypB/UreG, nucleotide-binding domain-containing protein [Microdochium trichocladiopsis]
MAAPIPITIVTGFLGSGKTTLFLNLLPQLRKANPSYKLALLKNEFGDVAVDSQLASSSAISGVQELLNGCICCNQVGQLSESLAELDAAISPDRIVIETSGSAFPATLAIEINRLARETGGRYTLDGVVSVIDVENWQGYEDTSYTARVQARYTDLIVFNKWELCDERRFDEVLDRVGDLELDIAWVKSDKGRVPVDVIFGIDGGLAQALDEKPAQQNGHSHGHDSHGHEHHGEEEEHKHDHQTEVEVLSVTLKPTSSSSSSSPLAVDPTKLLKLLKSAPKDEVYRIKSVLTAPTGSVASSEGQPSAAAAATGATATPPAASNQRYILNWAFGRWTFTPLASSSSASAGSQNQAPTATAPTITTTSTIPEHESSDSIPLRMTLILARYESTKWKKKLEAGGFLELLPSSSTTDSTSQDAQSNGTPTGARDGWELTVTKIA